MVQDLLADAQVLRGDLQQLVLCQELQAALQAQLADGDQAQSVVGAGRTGVGQVLGLADVHVHILAGSGVADDHALVHLLAGANQQGAALLSVEQAVRIFSTCLLWQICLSRNIAVTAMIAVAGSFLSELAAALCSFICISLNSSVSSHHIEKPVQKISEIGHMALPLTLNRLLLSVLTAIEVVLIPQCLRMYGLSPSEALSLYGVFTGMALPCILFPSTVTSSASVILMPSVAEMQALGHRRKIRYITRTTCAACILLGSLCTIVFYFLGNFAGTILFHNTDAGLYIRTLSFICPFLYTNIALTSILNGLGKTGTTLVHSVLGILLRISFVIFAIPVLGIRGYLYGLLLSEILLSLLHIYALYHMEF